MYVYKGIISFDEIYAVTPGGVVIQYVKDEGKK